MWANSAPESGSENRGGSYIGAGYGGREGGGKQFNDDDLAFTCFMLVAYVHSLLDLQDTVEVNTEVEVDTEVDQGIVVRMA